MALNWRPKQSRQELYARGMTKGRARLYVVKSLVVV